MTKRLKTQLSALVWQFLHPYQINSVVLYIVLYCATTFYTASNVFVQTEKRYIQRIWSHKSYADVFLVLWTCIFCQIRCLWVLFIQISLVFYLPDTKLREFLSLKISSIFLFNMFSHKCWSQGGRGALWTLSVDSLTGLQVQGFTM